jgi:hypothetical protein
LFWVVGKRPRIEDVDMIIGNKLWTMQKNQT